MTKEEAIRKHREMWRWLAKNPGEWNGDYLEKFDPEARLYHYCYLCAYVAENYGNRCNSCPVEWPKGRCCDDEELYSKWKFAMREDEYTRAAEIARQIAEVPEKEKIK